MSTPRSLAHHDDVQRLDIVVGEHSWASLKAKARDADASPHGTVLLVHGFTGSKEDFVHLIPELSGHGWDVIAIDQRGQHETAHDGAPLDIHDFAADIIAVAESLDTPAVHLVGHSFGGLAARRAALSRPDVLASLTLLNSGPAAIPDTGQSQALRAFIAAMRFGLVDAIWAHMEADRRSDNPAIPDDVLGFVERRLRSGHTEAHIAIAQALLDEQDHVEALSNSGVPVHVAYGVDDDVWPADIQRDMATRLGAVASPIDGAGHSPAVDDPVATALALHAWWRDHTPEATT